MKKIIGVIALIAALLGAAAIVAMKYFGFGCQKDEDSEEWIDEEGLKEELADIE